MTIQFKQVAQVSGISNLGTIEEYYCGYSFGFAVVINTTLPAVVFSYENDGYPAVGILIGNSAQYYGGDVSGETATIASYHTPIIFFQNNVLILAIYGSSGYSWDYTSSAIVYDIQSNTSNFTEYLLPQSLSSSYVFRGWLDAYLDFQNQNLYLLGINYNEFIVLLFAIPFSELPTLLNTLQLPTTFKEASLMPPNGENLLSYDQTYPPFCAEGGYDIAPTMIYYNEQFYLFFQSGDEDIYAWTFSLSEITWATTLPTATSSTIGGSTYYYVPSNLQTIGNVTNIIPSSEFPDIYIYYFNVSFNYYISNGSIYPEILVPVVLWNYTNSVGWSYVILSVNPSTLNVTIIANLIYTQISSSTDVYPVAPTYITGGLVIAEAYAYSSYYYIFVYDRNTGDTALFSPPSGIIFAVPAGGGYIIAVTGSYTNATITIYQVVADAVPVIANLQYSDNTITGTVEDLVNNTPVAGATVALFQLISQGGYEFSGTLVDTITTDSNGNFSFLVTQQGYYAIRAFT